MALAILVALIVGSTLTAFLFLRPATPQSGLHLYMSDLNWPVALAFAPDGRIFFTERLTGNVRIIQNGALLPTAFYSLPNTGTGLEQGLLGLTLDPDYPANPWVYVYQTYDDQVNQTTYNRIVRIEDGGGNRGVTHVDMVTGIPAGSTHNGGIIAFGPDMKLYAALGDAQTTPGNPSPAQDLRVLNGKTLRLNRDGTAPPDNPFSGRADAHSLVFTYGHRNVFGLAFHPDTGQPFITENGPDRDDEINLLLSGGNYGWPIVTGNANTPPFVDPVRAYTPPIAPTNAAFFISRDYPNWYGDLIFGDFLTSSLRRLELAPPTYESVASETVILKAPESILDVETRSDGTIWFTTVDSVYRYLPEEESSGIALSRSFCQGNTLDVEFSSQPRETPTWR